MPHHRQTLPTPLSRTCARLTAHLLRSIGRDGDTPVTTALWAARLARRAQTTNREKRKSPHCQETWRLTREQLDKKRDLYNLSRTCRVLEDMTMRRLYLKVDLAIPSTGPRHSPTPVLRPPVTQSMRHLAIRSSAGDKLRPFSASRPSPWIPESTRDLLVNIFDRVSPNQLTTFE